MTQRSVAVCALVLGAGLALGLASWAEDPAGEMDAWAKLAQPGEHHKSQEVFVGEWQATAKSSMGDPSKPASEEKGVARNRLVLGGRFVESTYQGSMGGMPFEGYGLSGYDNGKQKHIEAWMDTMGTQIMTLEGDCADGCKNTTLLGSMQGPGGAMIRMRSVTKVVSPTEHVFEMYMTSPDGKEAEAVAVTYRKGEGKPATGQEPTSARPPTSGTPSAEEEAWRKVMMPGPEHEALKALAGDWTTRCTFTFDPDKPPMVSEGAVKKEMILGGRFLKQEFKGEMMGQPFEGIGVWGYDNIRKMYVSLWADSMGTMIVQSVGTYDAATKTWTELAEIHGPESKEKQKYKTIWVSEKEHRFEMYRVNADGSETKVGEMVNTRK